MLVAEAPTPFFLDVAHFAPEWQLAISCDEATTGEPDEAKRVKRGHPVVLSGRQKSNPRASCRPGSSDRWLGKGARTAREFHGDGSGEVPMVGAKSTHSCQESDRIVMILTLGRRSAD